VAARTSRASRMIRLTAGLLVFTFEIMVAVSVAPSTRLVRATIVRSGGRTCLPEHHVAETGLVPH